MPTFNNPAKDAEEARQALRGLAHATREFDDPASVYNLLGTLSQTIASMEQTLHQIAAFHDSLKRRALRPVVADSTQSGYATSFQVSWELHRAAEITRQVGKAVDHAHELEARIEYSRPAEPTARANGASRNGISL